MIYTSTAHQIDREAMNAYDAMLVAEREAVSIDQDWQDGVSLFTFEDGSQLRVEGPTWAVYTPTIAE